MGCNDLLSWPPGILKILHLVFNLAVFVCLIIYYQKGEAPYHNSLILVWLSLFGILLVFSIVVMILVIMGNGDCKDWFFAYYVVGCSFAFVGMFLAGLFLDVWPQCSAGSTLKCGLDTSVSFYIPYVIGGVFTGLSFLAYAASAYFNSQGQT